MLLFILLIIIILIILYILNRNKNEPYIYTPIPATDLTPEQEKKYGYYKQGIYSPRAGPSHQPLFIDKINYITIIVI